MAVTIHDMQVDVDKPARPAASAATPKATEKIDLHEELQIRGERERRLKAD